MPRSTVPSMVPVTPVVDVYKRQRRRSHVEDDVVVEGEDDLGSAGVVLHGADNHPLRFLHGDAGKADVAGVGVAQAVGIKAVDFARKGVACLLYTSFVRAAL